MGARVSAEGDPGPAGKRRKRARTAKPDTIAVEAETAELLAARAAALGMTVSELIAALAAGAAPSGPAQTPTLPPDNDARFGDSRWREIKDWIDSWGKPGEKPRPKLGE